MSIQRRFFGTGVTLSEKQIEKISLFGALTSQQRDRLLRESAVRHCRLGEQIFCEGDLPSDIYIILRGRVDLICERDNVHQIKQILTQGECFGETAVIGIQPQAATAIASTRDVSLLVLTSHLLIDIEKNNKELFALLMMNIARDVSRKIHGQYC